MLLQTKTMHFCNSWNITKQKKMSTGDKGVLLKHSTTSTCHEHPS